MVKKIVFYSILSTGHLQVCASIGKALLDKKDSDYEVTFIVDKRWPKTLAKIDERFKFAVVEYELQNMGMRMGKLIKNLEDSLKMNEYDRIYNIWKIFVFEDELFMLIDEKSEEKIKEINPDFLLCDQNWILPTMINSKVPYGIIVSCNPLAFGIESPELPMIGSDCRMDEHEKIKEFKTKFQPLREKIQKTLLELLAKRNAKYEHKTIQIDQPLSEHFNIYTYPEEIDYFSDEIKEKFKLWPIDSAVTKERMPKPYEMPQEFKELPGKIVYVSLGSLFSVYTHLIQRLIDLLDKLPYKYIVSKGMFGHKVVFPSNKFIGEAWIDQLAVLQVVDAMIAHGGNNTLTECFFFGVPSIILPYMNDQINNGTRLEETGYGYQINNALDYTDEELVDTLNKLMADEELKARMKKASERIQQEDRISKVVDKIIDYVENKL